MGENLFVSLIGSYEGVPSLPIFLGNYILDIFSSFFPIIIIVVSGIMVYKGFMESNGNWQQAGKTLAPYAISIVAIMGILSMKTPYEHSDGSKFDNQFFANTNSYAIVELISSAISMSSTFADMIVHKVIYGSTEVSPSNVSYNGYFVNLVEARAEANAKHLDIIKTTLSNVNNLEEFNDKVGKVEREVGIQSRFLFDTYKKINPLFNYTSKENPDTIAKYNFATNNPNDKNSIIINKEVYPLTNIKNDIKKFMNEKGYKTQSGAMTYPNYYFLDSFDETKAKEKLSKYSSNETLLETLLNPYNVSFELALLNVVNEIIKNKTIYHGYYVSKLEQIEAIDSKVMEDLTSAIKADFTQKKLSNEQLLKEFYKYKLDLEYIIRKVNKDAIIPKDKLTSEILDKELGLNKNSELVTNFTQKELGLIDGYSYWAKASNIHLYEDIDLDKDIDFAQHLNIIIANKNARYFLIMQSYDKMMKLDRLLRDNTINSNSIEVLTYGSEKALQRIEMLDNERDRIMKTYIDENVGNVDVVSKLDQAIKEQHSALRKSELLYWTDLGKFYGTFKNLFNPLINNANNLQALNIKDDERRAEIEKFTNEINVEANIDRVETIINATAGASVVNTTYNTATSVVKKFFKIDLPKSDISLWEFIKTIGYMAFAMFFVSIFLPATLWLLAILTYYVEVSIFIAIFPLVIVFMAFSSYQKSINTYLTMLMSLVLYPTILVSIYFIVLYIDLHIPLFLNNFIPFFNGHGEFLSYYQSAIGSESVNSKVIGNGVGYAMNIVGNLVYTILNMILTIYLLMNFLKAHDYMSKIFSLSVFSSGGDSKETINKFTNMSPSGLTRA